MVRDFLHSPKHRTDSIYAMQSNPRRNYFQNFVALREFPSSSLLLSNELTIRSKWKCFASIITEHNTCCNGPHSGSFQDSMSNMNPRLKYGSAFVPQHEENQKINNAKRMDGVPSDVHPGQTSEGEHVNLRRQMRPRVLSML